MANKRKAPQEKNAGFHATVLGLGKEAWCLTSTETIRLIRDGENKDLNNNRYRVNLPMNRSFESCIVQCGVLTLFYLKLKLDRKVILFYLKVKIEEEKKRERKKKTVLSETESRK